MFWQNRGRAEPSLSVTPERSFVVYIGVGNAVVAAAQELARMTQVPGVAEAAGLVIVLMNLVTDSSNITGTVIHMVKRCRSVMVLLRRAASVLEEVRIDVTGDIGCL